MGGEAIGFPRAKGGGRLEEGKKGDEKARVTSKEEKGRSHNR